jgi:hypothetical protein
MMAWIASMKHNILNKVRDNLDSFSLIGGGQNEIMALKVW